MNPFLQGMMGGGAAPFMGKAAESGMLGALPMMSNQMGNIGMGPLAFLGGIGPSFMKKHPLAAISPVGAGIKALF